MSRPGSAQAAARLAHAAAGFPAGAEAEPPKSGECPGILEVLRANKVSLTALAADAALTRCRAWDGFAAAPEAREALEKERLLKEDLLRQFAPVSKALESRGIAHVLFKSGRFFPSLSSNLDVLVAPGFFAAAAEAVESEGHIRMTHYREDHKLLFRTFENGEPSLSVHLHEAVSWGKVLVLEGDGVVARSRPGEDPGMRAAAPEDLLATTLAHSVLETDQVRLSDLLTVRWCLAHGASASRLLEGASAERCLVAAAAALVLYDGASRACGCGPLLAEEDLRQVRRELGRSAWIRRRAERIAGSASGELPFRIPRSFAKKLLVRILMGDDRREPGRQAADLLWSVWNLAANRLGLRCVPASLVTVCGIDGSGKSTVVNAVMNALSVSEVPATAVWSRGGFSSLAVAGKALARRAAPSWAPGPADEARKRAFLASWARRALWSWWVALEQAAAAQRVRLLLMAGRTVVCDRYVYDSLADMLSRLPRGRGGGLPLRAAAFLLGAARMPDLALYIDVSPETAHARKPDGAAIETRRDLAGAYEGLSGLAELERLDGERPLAGVRQAAVEAALRCCLGRFVGARR